MRENGARIFEGKRFPLSFSLSLRSVGPHVLSVKTMCVYSVVSWGRLSLKRCVGDGRGRVGETLGRKPSRLCPKSEALAERSRRTAVLSGTAVERLTHPYTIKPNLGVPLSPAPWGAGLAPTPWSGTPFMNVMRIAYLGMLSYLRQKTIDRGALI